MESSPLQEVGLPHPQLLRVFLVLLSQQNCPLTWCKKWAPRMQWGWASNQLVKLVTLLSPQTDSSLDSCIFVPQLSLACNLASFLMSLLSR